MDLGLKDKVAIVGGASMGIGYGIARTRAADGARVAITGAGPVVFRVKSIEDALDKNWAPESCDGITVDADGLNGDMHASSEYRAHLIPVIARRAVAEAK